MFGKSVYITAIQLNTESNSSSEIQGFYLDDASYKQFRERVLYNTCAVCVSHKDLKKKPIYLIKCFWLGCIFSFQTKCHSPLDCHSLLRLDDA